MWTNPEIPEITIIPLPSEGGVSVRVVETPRIAREEQERIDRAWNEMVAGGAGGARLFDGPVLMADRASALRGELCVYPATYRYLAAGAAVSGEVRGLGIQAIVTGVDEDGDEMVLLGRRGAQTRMYPGMWENAPAGTVDVRGVRAGEEIPWARLLRVLEEEGLEEVGLELGACEVRAIALLDDAAARTVDIVVSAEVPGRLRAQLGCRINAGAWEYADTAWSPTRRVCGWLKAQPHAASLPTRALLGWRFGG